MIIGKTDSWVVECGKCGGVSRCESDVGVGGFEGWLLILFPLSFVDSFWWVCLGDLRWYYICLGVNFFWIVWFSCRCRCGAIGFPFRAERRVEVRSSFLCFRGLIVVWDNFVVQSFLVGFVVAVSSRVVWDVFSDDHFWFRVSVVGIGGIFPFVQRV